GPGEDLGRRIMGAAHVAGMAGVAAAGGIWGALPHQHRCAGAGGGGPPPPSTSTAAPARRALIAAHSAALPPPITSTSNLRVKSTMHSCYLVCMESKTAGQACRPTVFRTSGGDGF